MVLVVAAVAAILILEWQITKTVQRLRAVEKRCGIYDPEREGYVHPSVAKRVPRDPKEDTSEQKQAA